MTFRTFLTATALSIALGTTGAAAQQTAAVPGDYKEAEDEKMVVQPLNLTVGDLDDMEIVGPDGKAVGEVESVLMNGAGQVSALAVELEDAPGIGEKTVIMGLELLQADGKRLATGLSPEQLGGLPEWDD